MSSAYFLQFKFESGRYALVGRETIDGRDVLRIEYYPTKLFSERSRAREPRRVEIRRRAGQDKDDAYGDEVQRLMNKVSLVTIWVEPNQKQIVKYTFDNIGLDFLPAAWLVRVTDLKASMLMSEAFPGVWLPKRVEPLRRDSAGAGAVLDELRHPVFRLSRGGHVDEVRRRRRAADVRTLSRQRWPAC